MKKRFIVAIATLCTMIAATPAGAQETKRKIENVSIVDLDGNPTQIPMWGKKNLIIFYVDPDRASQNKDFTDELEESGRAKSENILGMGIINLKDAPFIPNRLARSMAEKRTEKNNALVLADQERTISKAWDLGDCNNQFVAILINKEGEMLYHHKGIMNQEDKDAFMKVVETMK